MSDVDLVKRLRIYALDWRDRASSKDIVEEAADRIEALAAEVERLGKCYDRAIASRLEWRRQAESAERALAEAVEIMRPLCKAVLPFTLNGDCTMVKAGTVKAARDFITAQEREKGK